MVILGLDPGVARTGYGVIDTSRPELFVRCGCITTSPRQPTADRLVALADDVTRLLSEIKTDRAVVESIFFGTNNKTAITTAQARGVLLYVLRRHHIEVETLTPLQIKSRLTGYGAADKQQVQTAIRQRLRLTAIPQPDDAADALAAALCASLPPTITSS